MGRGFVAALSRRWSEPEDSYRQWYAGQKGNDFALGAVQMVQVEPELWVANLIGQHGYRTVNGVPPIRYEAVAEGLDAVAGFAKEKGASVHMPRIGCGLAGGDWEQIAPIIEERLVQRGIAVTVYDLE